MSQSGYAGTIFDADDINSSLQAGGAPIAEERHGHGTATTGIAAGDGSGTTNREFRGVADHATIIVIKAYTRSFPAHGSQPGQTGVFSASNIITALTFAGDKIEELGMPGVAVVNAGTLGGPADGTSAINQAMDAFIARGHTLVCGSGDEGGQDNHTCGAIAQGQTEIIEFEKGDAGNLRFTLWYSEDDRFDIEIERPDTSTEGPFASPPTENSADDRFFPDINYFHRGKNQEFFGASSHRRMLLIDFFGNNGTYKVKVTAATVGLDGRYHAVLNPSFFYSNNKFTNPVPGYSIHDLASSFDGICPGDYVAITDWIDIDGVFRQITGQGDPGEIWLGSSQGPTQDERIGLDCAAPGEMLFAPYYPDSWWSSARFNLVQNGNELYGRQTAVSAANPLVAGVICLMLEANPLLTPAEVKLILQLTARQDSFTGNVPNTTWGYGKLDALAAVQLAQILLTTVEPNSHRMLDGFVSGGQLDDLFYSDDQYFELDPNPTINPLKQKINVVVEGTSTILTPNTFRLRLESRMTGGPSEDVLQTLSFRNVQTGRFETLDVRAVSNSDTLIEVTGNGNLSRFVNPTTGKVEASVLWDVPAFSGGSFNWTIEVDQAVWLID